MKKVLLLTAFLGWSLSARNWSPAQLAQVAPRAVASSSTLDTGLAAFWHLDEASGDAVDSVASLTLTDNNTVARTTGLAGNCGDFESGNSESFSKTDDTTMSTGDIDYSFACLVNLESTPGSGNSRGLLGKLVNSGQFEYVLRLNNQSSTIRFQWLVSGNGTSATTVSSTTFGAPTTATWYLIYCYHDAANNLIGIRVGAAGGWTTADTTAHTTGSRDGTDGFAIGTGGAGSTVYFDGLIDEVRFYKRLLTAPEQDELWDLYF